MPEMRPDYEHIRALMECMRRFSTELLMQYADVLTALYMLEPDMWDSCLADYKTAVLTVLRERVGGCVDHS